MSSNHDTLKDLAQRFETCAEGVAFDDTLSVVRDGASTLLSADEVRRELRQVAGLLRSLNQLPTEVRSQVVKGLTS
jgi:hypothetical protein